MLRDAGWLVNKKRVERIWRQERLKVLPHQPKRGRLWLNDGSCIRLRPEHSDHVWAYDFVEDRTHDGRKIRMLNIVDEFTREALAIRVARRLNSNDVIDVLSDLFILRGVPAYIRSDNGPEFVAKSVQAWIAAIGALAQFLQTLQPQLSNKIYGNSNTENPFPTYKVKPLPTYKVLAHKANNLKKLCYMCGPYAKFSRKFVLYLRMTLPDAEAL